MNKHAIYHITEAPFAYGKDLNTLVVRIRAASQDVKSCTVYYKDRYDWINPFEEKPMKVIAESELFDYFQGEISLKENRYRYYFKLEDKGGKVTYFDERGLSEKELEKKGATAFQYAYLAEGDLYEEEKWLQEAVVYQIFPDRFNNGDSTINPSNISKWGGKVSVNSMFGGDLQGVIDKIQYLKDLGVTLLYLTPIFKSATNHKYNTADYFDIDPQFGTLETAKELVEKCHENGIKIVFDAVFNHSGSDFFAFQDVVEKGEESKYKDWYHIYNFPVDTKGVNYYTFATNVSQMPKFNTNNVGAREYLLRVGEYWVKEIGIDGWRLDVCDEVDHEFWRAFKKVVKAANKEAIIIGEIMHEANSFLKGDELDSIMNYPFKFSMVEFFGYRTLSVEKFNDILAVNRALYMDSITRQLWNLLGSHDTKRFLTECDDYMDRMKLAIGFQFSYIGVPYIYYGDEVGLNGGDDPQCRKCMIWDEKKQNKELLDFYKKMINIRKENQTLVYGDYNTIYCKDNVLIFERTFESNNIIIAVNNNKEAHTISLDIKGSYEELLTLEKISIERSINLKPMGIEILRKI